MKNRKPFRSVVFKFDHDLAMNSTDCLFRVSQWFKNDVGSQQTICVAWYDVCLCFSTIFLQIFNDARYYRLPSLSLSFVPRYPQVTWVHRMISWLDYVGTNAKRQPRTPKCERTILCVVTASHILHSIDNQVEVRRAKRIKNIFAIISPFAHSDSIPVAVDFMDSTHCLAHRMRMPSSHSYTRTQIEEIRWNNKKYFFFSFVVVVVCVREFAMRENDKHKISGVCFFPSAMIFRLFSIFSLSASPMLPFRSISFIWLW